MTDSGSSPKKSAARVKDEKVTNENDQEGGITNKSEEEKKQEEKSGQVTEEVDDSESSLDQKEEYESVDPKTLEEAEAKIAQEKILIEENQFVRYERAREIITRGGLTINIKLIESNYERI